MHAATLAPPRAPQAPAPVVVALAPAPGAAPRRTKPDGEERRRRRLYRPALAVILLGTLALRLWGIKQGLPYSYNVDEATHFVPRAVGFFSHDLDPQYFLNPPAYTYLLHVALELWYGSADAVSRAYATDPTDIFLIGRVLAAVLGTVAVWLTYLAGVRLFDRAVALLAAAIFAVASLPVFYSHLALNDVPTLAPVALSLYGVAGVLRHGRLRDYAIAGVGIGLAAATKYTGGFTALCLLAAFSVRAAGGPRWPAVRGIAAGGTLALAAFVVANPYSVLDWSAFTSGVSQQASLAAGSEPVKLGTTAGGGIAFYLWTFTWGLGWGPLIAAVAGSGLLLAARRWATALVLVPAPIAFVVFMGSQQRYFGRWLMPTFPIVVLLGAYGTVALVRWTARARRVPAPVMGFVAAVLLLTQSIVAVVHDDRVLSRPDTRNLTRAWMVAHVPAGARVVIEPVVPDNWATDVGRSLTVTATGERWYRYPTWLTDVDARGRRLPGGQLRYVLIDQYERTLRPQLIDEYVKGGYCWVVVGSLQAGRAFAQPQLAPEALAYYAALANRATLMYHVSPFTRPDETVPFSFDWSIDYYPPQYRLPGPEISVYHLNAPGCG